MLDLQTGRLDLQSVQVPGANDVAIPAIGSVGWAGNGTLLLSAKPYTETQCSSGRQWKVPATLYSQLARRRRADEGRGRRELVRPARRRRLESRCPTGRPVPAPGSELRRLAALLVDGTTRTTLPLTGGPLALLPG